MEFHIKEEKMKDTELKKDTTHTADYITGFRAGYDAGYEAAKYGTEAASAAIKMVWEISGRIAHMSPVVFRAVFGVEPPGEVFKMIIRSFLSKKTKKESPPVPVGQADILLDKIPKRYM